MNSKTALQVASPLLTVVIPTYERERELRRAVESLSQPGYDRIAVLISNNASTDGTRAYCDSLDTPFPVVAKHNEQNVGICNNFYQASAAVTTPYQLWMTDDDFILPGGLAKVLQAIADHPQCAYFYSHLHSITDDANIDAEPIYLHGPSTSDLLIQPGVDAVIEHARYGWGYSRQVIRTDAIDWNFWKSQLQNSYIPILISGRIMLQHPAYYQADSIIAHTVHNACHWDEFGDSDFEIGLKTQADYRNSLGAILAETPQSTKTKSAIAVWERGCEELILEISKQDICNARIPEAYRAFRDRYKVSPLVAMRLIARSRSRLIHKLHLHRGKHIRHQTVQRSLKNVA